MPVSTVAGIINKASRAGLTQDWAWPAGARISTASSAHTPITPQGDGDALSSALHAAPRVVATPLSRTGARRCRRRRPRRLRPLFVEPARAAAVGAAALRQLRRARARPLRPLHPDAERGAAPRRRGRRTGGRGATLPGVGAALRGGGAGLARRGWCGSCGRSAVGACALSNPMHPHPLRASRASTCITRRPRTDEGVCRTRGAPTRCCCSTAARPLPPSSCATAKVRHPTSAGQAAAAPGQPCA
jgi:hypothetical protein